MVKQLNGFFEHLFAPQLSGFRKNHNCSNVLLDFIEKCKTHKDKNEIYCTILTDLSKAFDCLPHNLLIAKMKAYGVQDQALKLICNYFYERLQRVKLGNERSEWCVITKGAPQGSLIGPFAFNIHINDLIHKLSTVSDVFNYADDTTVSCSGPSYAIVEQNMKYVISFMTDWFLRNQMKVNPDKFQLIVFDKGHTCKEYEIKIDSQCIRSQECVKLLGLTIDQNLTFSKHISELCKRAGRKINALARISRNIDTTCKINIFNAFVMSHFKYCSFFWNLGNMSDLRKIEQIQYRALRFVYCDFQSSYSELRSKWGHPLMYIKSVRDMLIEVFKIVNKMGPSYLDYMFSLKANNKSTRSIKQLQLLKFNTINYGKRCVTYKGAFTWNGLHNDIKSSQTLSDFKRAILKWEMLCKCHNCSMCKLDDF